MAGSDLQDIEESIRIATAGDVALVAELAAAAVAELTPTRGGRIASEQEFRAIPAHDSVAAAIADPKQLVLVGQFDPAQPRHTWEQPVSAWVRDLEFAGFTNMESTVLHDYWWATAHLITATGNRPRS